MLTTRVFDRLIAKNLCFWAQPNELSRKSPNYFGIEIALSGGVDMLTTPVFDRLVA